MKYRIRSSHCGDAPEVYGVFVFASDDEARQEFERIKNLPSNGYDKMWMERIDVEEKTTSIC